MTKLEAHNDFVVRSRSLSDFVQFNAKIRAKARFLPLIYDEKK